MFTDHSILWLLKYILDSRPVIVFILAFEAFPSLPVFVRGGEIQASNVRENVQDRGAWVLDPDPFIWQDPV